MLPLLEVRIREAEENGGELGVVEVVGEEFHGVGAEGGDVLVGSREIRGGLGKLLVRMLGAKGGDARGHVVEDLSS